ncbi:hypothetical protein GCM10009760_07730 [Kitasatospora kazusensis]|uniref:DUF4034 domain-containing protein n=1 Tax=Kitasatospora kazusensis TaxID=407974 RepID=A0ABN2YWP3_9ACTN
MSLLITMVVAVAGGWAFMKLHSWRVLRRAAAREAREADELRAQAPATIVPSRHGLVPRAELVLVGTRHSPEAAAALDAARSGDWRPAAAYLTASGADGADGADADRRWARAVPFTDLAVEDDAWLQAWRREQPQNAEAAVLHARALVGVAWEIRTRKRAHQVTREQAAGFHRVLGEAEAAAREAVLIAPADDPNPWVVLLPVARGHSWDNDRVRELWSEITARDPQHWAAHGQALQYWCEKWHGSHAAMHEFIDTAIAAAPVGSLLAPRKLEALWEQYAGSEEAATAYRTAQVSAALDTALADLAAADPGHPGVEHARGWLAFMLGENGRPAEAVAQFQALKHTVPWPWADYHDPLSAFTGDRAAAVLAAPDASNTPDASDASDTSDGQADQLATAG